MFKDDLLHQKRILVTGGGTGLGRSMVRRFLQLGARPIICGRRGDVLEQTATELEQEIGRAVEFHACDLRQFDEVEAMIARIFASEPLDVLVNSAAGNFVARTETLSPRAVDAVLNVVAHGTAHVTMACGRRWLADALPGTVLSIVTTYAFTGSAYVVPSAMAKAAVLAMTRSLAVEWGRNGIRLNAIAPGPFPTAGAWERLVPRPDLAKALEAKNPLGRVGRHEELADLAVYLVSDNAGYMNGEVVVLDGGEWLQGAGEFNFLSRLTDEDWANFKPKKGR
jgi:NAD(P)-dependent dehydrogenase (short-subunit alcohol dehydrogenase family)